MSRCIIRLCVILLLLVALCSCYASFFRQAF